MEETPRKRITVQQLALIPVGLYGLEVAALLLDLSEQARVSFYIAIGANGVHSCYDWTGYGLVLVLHYGRVILFERLWHALSSASVNLAFAIEPATRVYAIACSAVSYLRSWW